MVETFCPRTLAEALNILDSQSALPFAGGTDLMVKYKSWQGTLPEFPRAVLLLKDIEELRGIRAWGGKLSIGALETLGSILASPLTPPILKKAISLMASPSVRNMGTIGGNICNASPAGDTLPPLYVLDATVILKSASGRREVPISNFIAGPGKTVKLENELLTEIRIPQNEVNILYYRKVGTRKADALSKLSIAGLAQVEDGKIKAVRLALGAVAPQVVRSREAEALFTGKDIKELQELRMEIASAYSDLIHPIDDQRSSAAYRKTISMRLIEDFITQIHQGPIHMEAI